MCYALCSTGSQGQFFFAIYTTVTCVICVHQTAQKQFIEAVRRSDVHKLAKLCGKGLDPNFQDTDTGGMLCVVSA